MKENIGEKMDAIKEAVGTAWTAIKENPTVQAIFDYVKNTFNNLKDTIMGVLVSALSGAIAGYIAGKIMDKSMGLFK